MRTEPNERFRPFARTPLLYTLLGTYGVTSFLPLVWIQAGITASVAWGNPAATAGFWLGLLSVPVVAVGATYFLRRDLWAIEATLVNFGLGLPLPVLPSRPTAAFRRTIESLISLTGRSADLSELRESWRRRIEETAAQEERNRLARDLHDSIKQQLFSIHLGAATARERWDSDAAGARDALARVRSSAHQAVVEMQALLQQLEPAALAETGLVAALREQCEALAYRTEAKVHFAPGDVREDLLSVPVREEIFRFAQEALSNVARHARARQVWVDLISEEGLLTLRIRDDGQGFAVKAESRGMGLRNLQQRALSLGAFFQLRSKPGKGTQVLLEVPLTVPDSAASKSRDPVSTVLQWILSSLAVGPLAFWLILISVLPWSGPGVRTGWELVAWPALVLIYSIVALKKNGPQGLAAFGRAALCWLLLASFKLWDTGEGGSPGQRALWYGGLFLVGLFWLGERTGFYRVALPRWRRKLLLRESARREG